MKIESQKKGDVITLIIANDNNEFLAKCHLTKINDDLLVVSGPIGRKTYGKTLYQAAAMLANKDNKFVVSDRSGSTRESAMNNWLKFLNNEYKCNKIEIPEEHCEKIDFTNIDDDPVYFHGFNMKPTKKFENSHSEVKEFSFPKRDLEEWDTFYGIGYDLENTKFIDEDYPVTIKESNGLDEPVKQRQRIKKRI